MADTSLKDTLEKKLTEVEQSLDSAANTLGQYACSDLGVLDEVEAQMQLLGDQLAQRVQSLPKGVTEVRMSKLNIATLSRVICDWATSLRETSEEVSPELEKANKDAENLSTASVELAAFCVEFLNQLESELNSKDPKLPELDVGSMLRNAGAPT